MENSTEAKQQFLFNELGHASDQLHVDNWTALIIYENLGQNMYYVVFIQLVFGQRSILRIIENF